MSWNRPSFNDLQRTMIGLRDFCQEYSECVGIDWSKVTWAAHDLLEVSIRFHKAIDYYEVYHDEDLQEPYEAAILAYWILKLRVFRSEDENFSTINTKIAALLLYSVVAWQHHGLLGSGEFWGNLCYALHYRDLGHEAIMHLTEALVA